MTAYLDGVLTAAERARFEAHLEECEDCRAYVAQFAQTLIALWALRADQGDPDCLATLVAAFRAGVG